MNQRHIHPAEAELYVLGEMEPEAAAALEAHTLECAPCAAVLQREALLEEQLREVAQATVPDPQPQVLRPARWSRPARAAVGVLLAAAAAVALVLLRPEQADPSPPQNDFPILALPESLPEEPLRLVACPDLSSQEACAAQAFARGLMVQYPQGVGEVPRYDGHAGLPPGVLEADGPYSL